MISKIIAATIITFLHIKTATPPNKLTKKDKFVAEPGWLPYFLRLGPIAHVLSLSILAAYILLQFQGYPDMEVWNSVEIVGFVIGVIGALLRLWCFHTLGKFFTFSKYVFY